MVAIGCTILHYFGAKWIVNCIRFNKLMSANVSPEKAGVGGSSPSLATIPLIRIQSRDG